MFEIPIFNFIKNVLSLALYKNNVTGWKLILWYTGFQTNFWSWCKIESYSWENFVNLENVMFQLSSKVMFQIQQHFVGTKLSTSHFCSELFVKFWSWVNSLFQLFSWLICSLIEDYKRKFILVLWKLPHGIFYRINFYILLWYIPGIYMFSKKKVISLIFRQ